MQTQYKFKIQCRKSDKFINGNQTPFPYICFACTLASQSQHTFLHYIKISHSMHIIYQLCDVPNPSSSVTWYHHKINMAETNGVRYDIEWFLYYYFLLYTYIAYIGFIYRYNILLYISITLLSRPHGLTSPLGPCHP